VYSGILALNEHAFKADFRQTFSMQFLVCCVYDWTLSHELDRSVSNMTSLMHAHMVLAATCLVTNDADKQIICRFFRVVEAVQQ
jgi:hypothetical protein